LKLVSRVRAQAGPWRSPKMSTWKRQSANGAINPGGLLAKSAVRTQASQLDRGLSQLDDQRAAAICSVGLSFSSASCAWRPHEVALKRDPDRSCGAGRCRYDRTFIFLNASGQHTSSANRTCPQAPADRSGHVRYRSR